MCGIAGLFSKSPELSDSLGRHLGDMLLQLGDRGPDSAGVAIYRTPAPSGSCKVTLHSPAPGYKWSGVQAAPAAAFGAGAVEVRASHAVITVETDADTAVAWLRERYPELRVMSAGEAIEIYKEAGHPPTSSSASRSRSCRGSHALGHTRMATESKVTTDGSHPFDRPRPVPRPQRLALPITTGREKRSAYARRGSNSRPRTTLRSPPGT